MKLTLETLIDFTTGKPLVIDVDENFYKDTLPLRIKAFQSGKNFLVALMKENRDKNEQS